jgi:Arc/MetJ-type ribon-helix-helix transcriptional regulator
MMGRNGIFMTLQVFLSKELKNLAQGRIESGIYGSASELIEEAFRIFLNLDEILRL